MTTVTLAEAADPLPKGTFIAVPTEDTVVSTPTFEDGYEPKSTRVLHDDSVLLSNHEAKQVLLTVSDLKACQTWLEKCEAKQIAVTPKGGYFTTPQGHAVMIGGFAVSVSAAFVLGAVFVK